MFCLGIEEDDDDVESDDETAKAISKLLSNSSGPDAPIISKNKLKGKPLKQNQKGKTLKSSSRRNSVKPPPKSFLEQNIKGAGNTADRRRTIDFTNDNADTNSQNTALNPETDSESTLKRNSICGNSTNKVKTGGNRKVSLKEQKALHSAYVCLLEEYHRREEVRNDVTVKFGRANAKLKIMISQNKTENSAPNGLEKPTLNKKKANNKEKSVEDKQSKGKGKGFRAKAYVDPDRV